METTYLRCICEICEKQFEVREKELQWRTPKYCSTECYDKSRTGQKRKPYIKAEDRPCETCGTLFHARTRKARFCSRDCLYASMRGAQAANWKGGRRTTAEGYVKIYMPEHPNADKDDYISEHRHIMESYLGRILVKGETVHHIDGNKGNNSIENLQLRIGNHGKHQSYCCADCGSRRIAPCELE